jgi:hypothetical protein
MLSEECSHRPNRDSLSNQAVEMMMTAAWAAGAVATEPVAVFPEEFGRKGLFVCLLFGSSGSCELPNACGVTLSFTS